MLEDLIRASLLEAVEEDHSYILPVVPLHLEEAPLALDELEASNSDHLPTMP